jgi:Glycosyl transferase WecG/TagA/CpsF family
MRRLPQCDCGATITMRDYVKWDYARVTIVSCTLMTKGIRSAISHTFSGRHHDAAIPAAFAGSGQSSDCPHQRVAPDIVRAGSSTAKQEFWMASFIGRLNAPVLVGVGAAFDFLAAPRRRSGCKGAGWNGLTGWRMSRAGCGNDMPVSSRFSSCLR